MELYLLRHAIAVERGTAGYEDDSLRPLTREGRRKTRDATRGLRRLGLVFDHILSSPCARARETAEIVASGLRLGRRLKFTEHLEPGGSPRHLLRALARWDRPGSRVLLVGHEPDLSELIAKLIGGPRTLGIHFKKGALCKLTTDRLRFGACAALEWLLTSRHLARLR